MALRTAGVAFAVSWSRGRAHLPASLASHLCVVDFLCLPSRIGLLPLSTVENPEHGNKIFSYFPVTHRTAWEQSL